ncbi:hypothetical protein HanRHA438_Chr03g0147931 [Helianthus annuus]|nr:hypothetical protein HanRHA438_Chr03g0147931 [Helianthus annuus]
MSNQRVQAKAIIMAASGATLYRSGTVTLHNFELGTGFRNTLKPFVICRSRTCISSLKPFVIWHSDSFCGSHSG